MEQLSLTQIFGEGAFQDENILVIQKSSLLRLTPSPNNTAASLMAAIVITALDNFQGIITDENNQPITNENNQPITFDNSEVFELLKIIGWQPFQIRRSNKPYMSNQIIVFAYEPN
ncbi:hypothetical protein JYQ62_08310 [Nostoc sp. UHCC 0702]|nr:hypothetical protein JYQ62_08310 [Nostoc sp. UHCC 0702]